MASGRLRSSLPLLRKILTVDSVSPSTQGSGAFYRALTGPFLANPEFYRSYATAAAKDQNIKVPVSLSGVSGNYASALYLAAVKANVLEKIESEFLDLVEASKKSPAFSDFSKDMSIAAKVRVEAIFDICTQAKLSDPMKNFLALLAEHGRLGALPQIADRFRELIMAHRGEVKAVVTSVIPLPPEEERELKETLQIVLKGKKVMLEQKIDPSILGGLLVEFGDKLFDMSIRTRARQMEAFLREAVRSSSI